jgi:hypothetical protein
LDWNRWNNKVFVRLFGTPDALKHPTEVVALAKGDAIRHYRFDSRTGNCRQAWNLIVRV